VRIFELDVKKSGEVVRFFSLVVWMELKGVRILGSNVKIIGEVVKIFIRVVWFWKKM